MEENKPLKITAEQEIIEIGKAEEEDEWLPMAPSQTEAPIKVTAEPRSDALLASGPGTKGQVPSKAGGMQDGLRVDPKDWKFSNPQGDGAYKAVGKWIHMKVGRGHNIWYCRRHQAPILSTVIQEFFNIASSGQPPTAISADIIQKIEHLSSRHTAGGIATKLNEAVVIHPRRGTFDTNAIVYLLKRFNIPSLKQRLRAAGYLSQHELAERCGVTVQTVLRWRRQGWIRARRYNDQPEYLYEPKFDALPLNIARRYNVLLLANEEHDHDSEKRM